ncbi:MAG: TetR/AcrR family transcriptional regulator [Actinomycetota bacterium]|nr:TetR/AcrR family transcriptional regulator [Actinomycetota bacterium]
MPTSSSTRKPTRWVGLSPEDRVAERRGLLLDAAFELLGTDGASGTSVRAVCQRARLNPRYFYESFEDLDELIVAVYERLVTELATLVFNAVANAGPEPRDQFRATLEATVGFVDEDRRRGRVLYVEALGNEALNRRRIETAHQLVAAVEQHGRDAHGRIPSADPIGGLAAAMLVGGAGELVVSWLEGRITITREQLVDDATELFLAVGDAAARIAKRRSQ